MIEVATFFTVQQNTKILEGVDRCKHFKWSCVRFFEVSLQMKLRKKEINWTETKLKVRI